MFVFPAHRFNPDPVRADVQTRVISGGESLSGDEDVIATDGGGRWEITYANIDLDEPEMLRLWSAWVSHMAGGAQKFLVPILSLETAPRPIAGSGPADPSDIYADDDMFPTEVRFADPYIVATVAANAALRATTLQITVTKGARIRGGEKCSIGGRGFKIERVTSQVGMTSTCIVSPPAREAISAGAAVNFEWPVVQCKAIAGQTLSPDIEHGQYASVSVAFVEDFTADG